MWFTTVLWCCRQDVTTPTSWWQGMNLGPCADKACAVAQSFFCSRKERSRCSGCLLMKQFILFYFLDPRKKNRLNCLLGHTLQWCASTLRNSASRKGWLFLAPLFSRKRKQKCQFEEGKFNFARTTSLSAQWEQICIRGTVNENYKPCHPPLWDAFIQYAFQ